MLSLENMLTERFLFAQRENVGELNISDWALIEEAIQDDLTAGPEREFYVNALEHSRIGNLRLAVVESVICLEIVLTQWLLQVLPRRGVRNVDELLAGPRVDLFTRVKLLLPLLLPEDRLDGVNLDDVIRAVNLRNKIAHTTGNLPPGMPPDSIRSGVSAVLIVARLLAFERDRLTREPELDKLADRIGVAVGLLKPKIFAIDRHQYSVAFEIPFPDEMPPDERQSEIATQVNDRMVEYDPRYRPGTEAGPAVAFTRAGQPVSLWLDGKLKKVVRKPNRSFLEFLKTIPPPPSGEQEG
jgi:hypothetical protein